MMDTFAALADPTRRHIVVMLASNGQLPASRICERFAVSAPAISQHLKVLRQAKLVRMEKRAQQRLYSVNPGGIDEIEQWAGQVRAFWDQRFNALDALLKEETQKRNPPKTKRGKRHARKPRK